jgi:hypothetical protein
MRPGMELRLNRHMIAADQATGWIHEPGVGTSAVVEIRRRNVMPGTRARRAREYRAGASSLELIGERPTPANCVEHRDWRPSSWRLSPSGQRDRHRRRRRSQSPGFTFHVLPFTVPGSDARAAAKAAQPTCTPGRAPVLF